MARKRTSCTWAHRRCCWVRRTRGLCLKSEWNVGERRGDIDIGIGIVIVIDVGEVVEVKRITEEARLAVN